MKELRIRRSVYTLCFFALSIINWIMGSMPGRVQFIAANCTGVIVAILIFSGYSFKEFLRPLYAVWTGVIALFAPFVVYYGFLLYPYKGQFLTALLNVCVYGYIVLKVCEKLIIERKIPKINWRVFIGFIFLMIYMFASRNEAIWPLFYMIMFGGFYLTEYDKCIKLCIYKSISDGLILGFFVIQGLALLFRPYDEARYLGLFLNSNINALFYVVSYCAFLTKYVILMKEKRFPVVRTSMLIIACSMFGFCVLTGSRSGMLTLVAVTISFMICILNSSSKKVTDTVKYVVRFVGLAFASIPITYIAVRYVPTIHLHPIFFESEYNYSWKVHSGEPINSENYISFDEMIRYNVIERVNQLFEHPISDKYKPSVIGMEAYASDLSSTKIDNASSLIEEGGDVSGFNIRYQIYKWYIKRLNTFGHHNSDHKAILINEYGVPHAHNWFLQLSFNFGIPVGIIFMLGIVLFVKRFFMFLNQSKEIYAFTIGSYITEFLTFGLFEANFFVGQISFTLVFILFLLVVQMDL